MASRIASTSPSASSASAPCASAACASVWAGPRQRRARSRRPRRWLGSDVAGRSLAATVAERLRCEPCARASRSSCSSRRCPRSRPAPCRRRSSAPRGADFLAGPRGLGPHRRAGRERPDRRRSTTAASTGSRAAPAATSSPSTPATASPPTARSSARASPATGTGTPSSQHESEVEPDSLTVGATTVAVFQVGRNRSGGAASIGFSTSRDGGRTWREGILPGLTVNTLRRRALAPASDPVVAYDAAHGVWLANTLAIAQGVTRLTIHRSRDGLAWTGPIDAALARTRDLAYDKNWLTCDNGAGKPVPRPLLSRLHARRRPAERGRRPALGRRRPHVVAAGDAARSTSPA